MRTQQTRHSSAGFTLVELLVALALSLMLGVAMLKMQGSLAQQTVKNADMGVRDEQWRVAVDNITRTTSSSGFLLGGTQSPCSEMFTYNLGATGSTKFFTHHAVDSSPAAAGANLPYAVGLTLNYPPAGSTMPSDVLAVTTSTDSSDFSDGASPGIVLSNGFTPANAYSPTSNGVIPVVSTTGLPAAGDVAVLRYSNYDPSFKTVRVGCIRTKITGYGSAGGVPNIATSGALSPPGFFNDFAAPMTAANYNQLTDQLMYTNSVLYDMSSTPTARTSVYYIDGSTYPVPVLMNAQYAFADDTLVAGTQKVIAAGVVSMQVLYGVDAATPPSGSVTVYEKAATVTTNKQWEQVRTVKILLVTRSLNDDISKSADGTAYTAPTPLPIPAGFAAVPVLTTPTDFSKRHYTVSQFEVAERNTLMNCPFTGLCQP